MPSAWKEVHRRIDSFKFLSPEYNDYLKIAVLAKQYKIRAIMKRFHMISASLPSCW